MTFTTARSDHSWKEDNRGFSLAELLISFGISALTVGGLTSSYVFLAKSSVGIGNYVDMNMQSRYGLEIFARDVRSASRVLQLSGTGFDVRTETPGGSIDVNYTFDSSNKVLVRTAGVSSFPIFKNVENLSIQYFNLVGDPTTNVTEAKRIQIDAEMRRELLHVDSSQYVISTRYSMRNRYVSN